MRNLELILSGADAKGAAQDLAAALGDETLVHAVRQLVLDEASEHKAIDPIAVAGLVLAIPGVILAALDLADRIKKRQRAKTMIETAARIRIERRVEVLTITVDGTKALADLDPDAVLDLVDED